ncbi:hypothetical protein BofuT4_P093810.1 [Botrytis cinerea T4]|uniref:Uncharacterized protein n=1 Tax=Botryotinia fuckeliana (strain T4) TaxID=999810 RepID=G2YD25_BOTF4|nr:hypothetical protein BofuT4_P093810.1 [Botrytis cinerea T4]
MIACSVNLGQFALIQSDKRYIAHAQFFPMTHGLMIPVLEVLIASSISNVYDEIALP